MIRDITNRLDGRKKVTSKSMDYPAVQGYLANMDPDTSINVVYDDLYKKRASFKDVRPSDVAEFLEREFEPGYSKFFIGEHQVYAGQSDDRHYIDVAVGFIRASIGDKEVRRQPHESATLEFWVAKEE